MKKYILGLLSGIVLLAACDDNKTPYLNLEDASLYFDTDQNRFVPSVSENNKILKVPVILASIPGTYPLSVTVATDIASIENPAREGTDFYLKKKEIVFEEGYGTKYIEVRTIDNAGKNPARQFDLVIASTSYPLKHHTEDRIRITILDDEHPLKELFGTYSATGLEVFENKVYTFNMQMFADSEDESMVRIKGFPDCPNKEVKIRIDLDNKICSIPANQEIDVNTSIVGLTMICKCFRKEDGFLGYDFEDIPGIVNEEATEFSFTEWLGAVILQEGEHKGGAFFAYKNFTLTKKGK